MFRKIIIWRGKKYESLEDIIERDLDILFVGICPSVKSVESGHYHQGMPGTRFWDTVIRARILKPKAGFYPDQCMLSQKLGLTDLVKKPGRGMADMEKEDLNEGRRDLFQKIVEFKPRIVCAIYKTVFEMLFETSFTRLNGFVENFRIGPSRMFILAPFFYPRTQREETARQLYQLRQSQTGNKKKRQKK